MLGLQGSSSSSKVYRCMACSATFTGLSSLLVHQATHAAAISAPVPGLPSKQHETMAVAHRDLSQHQPPPPSSAIVLFESPSDSLYICDCGDEFKDFNLMLEHKRVHLSNPHLLQPRDPNLAVHSVGEKSHQAGPARQESHQAGPARQESHQAGPARQESHQAGPPLQQSLGSSDTRPVLAPTSSPAPERHAIATAELQSVLLPDTTTRVDAGAVKDATAVSAPREQSESPRRPTGKESDNLSTVEEPLPAGVKDMSEVIQDMTEAIQDMPEPEEDVSEDVQEDDPSCNDGGESVPGMSLVSKGEHLPKANNFMKLLATAYMRFQPSPSEVAVNKPLLPKTEVVPVEITQEASSEAPLNTDPSVSQLRQLLKKPAVKTKSPGVGRILDSSTKSIVSLTKTFSPVVLLETRQTLVDPTNGGAPGIYQCGRCRRVFKDVDALTEHHSMHRKERIKCCRHCKKLIIGKMPFPDNHVCPQLSGKAAKQSNYPKTWLPQAKSAQSFNHLKQQNANQKRVFFCPTCKHSYARRYNLKMHKCHGPRAAAPPHNAHNAHQKQTRLASIPNGNRIAGVAEMPILGISKNVAVGTDKVKMEPNSGSDLAWSGTAKSFPPFFPQVPVLEQLMDASQSTSSALLGEASLQWDAAVDPQVGGLADGQWTVPLGEEMEALSETDLADMEDDEVEELVPEGLENSPTNVRRLPFFVSNGVRRYPCGRCQKTYSRQATLRRHLMLCGTRQPGFGAAGPVQHFFGAVPYEGSKTQPPQQQQQQQMFDSMAPKVNKSKPMFDCYVCGKSFNRKDNMLVHRNKCELNRTVTGGQGSGGGAAAKQSFSGGPAASSADANKSQKEDVDGNNWGIMSLPSVLPRRVTCECGLGFTSPRLLLEHLQKHAQESYTCPTCGETVGSWADYEVHLQIHMHPHHQLYKGLQPKRSQPLLLRFQQQPSPPARPPPPPRPHPPPKQQQQQQQQQQHHYRPPPILKAPAVQQLSTSNRGKGRITCTRCNNTFSSRCSLRRHVSLNRCKGAPRVPPRGVANLPNKSNRCSRCNADFPSTVALVFHQRSGACCRPTSKPMRCPVCARWFGTVEGLQRHLLTHNNQTQSQSHHHHQAYRCDVCTGSYPNLKSLKNHRRRVHRIMAGDVVVPRPKLEPLDS